MRISIITMFPEFFESPLKVSIVGRAIDRDVLEVDVRDLRGHGIGAHRQLDDAPFGGGPGMVMMVQPIFEALRPLEGTHKVLLSPAGSRITQRRLEEWSGMEALTLVCGRYEGVDERVAIHLVDEEASIGDFVLAGGEAAALVIVEGVARLLGGALGNPESLRRESFSNGLLEEPHYTRPAEFEGWTVPEVLLSGDHAAIEAWRQEQREARTRSRRPDLLEKADS